MTRNQRSYYAVIRELKATYGLTHTQARKARKALTGRLGEAPRLKDLKAHPRITKQEATKAVGKPKGKRGGGGRGVGPKKEIKSLSDWSRYLDDYDGGFEEIEYDDTGGYKED
jgi:hypothetical protein